MIKSTRERTVNMRGAAHARRDLYTASKLNVSRTVNLSGICCIPAASMSIILDLGSFLESVVVGFSFGLGNRAPPASDL